MHLTCNSHRPELNRHRRFRNRVDSKVRSDIFPVIRVLWAYKAMPRYNGTIIVNRSIALNEPVIYVSMNYR
jgi:hypothetical protein